MLAKRFDNKGKLHELSSSCKYSIDYLVEEYSALIDRMCNIYRLTRDEAISLLVETFDEIERRYNDK